MPIRDQRAARRAAAAGMFYDADALSLRRRLAESEVRCADVAFTDGRACGVVLPHAGYIYSLDTAMRTLLAAGARRMASPRRVVIIGPSHYTAFSGAALANFDVWTTPFGEVTVDRELRRQLLEAGAGAITLRDDAQLREHAIEVQLPLIQYFFPGAVILPVVVGSLTAASAGTIGAALAAAVSPDDFFIISSDFTHYGVRFGYAPFGIPAPPERLKALDRGAAEQAARRDMPGLAAYLRKTGATVCGANPLMIYLSMLEAAGSGCRGEVVAQSDSGELTGDYSHVVGYVGIVFSEPSDGSGR